MFIAELCSRSLEGGSANPRSNDESLTEARTILPVLVSISTAQVTIQLDLNFGNDTVLPVESVSCWEGIVAGTSNSTSMVSMEYRGSISEAYAGEIEVPVIKASPNKREHSLFNINSSFSGMRFN